MVVLQCECIHASAGNKSDKISLGDWHIGEACIPYGRSCADEHQLHG